MGTFGIYCIFLTTALFLYYCVVVLLDLLKKDGKGREDVEVIEASDDDDQDAPTPVSLIDGQIHFGAQPNPEEESPSDGDTDGGGDGGDYGDDDGEGDTIFDAPEEETAFNDYEEDGDGELTDDQYQILHQQFQENMEPEQPQYQHVYDSTAFHVVMGQPKGIKSRVNVAKTYPVK